MNKGRFTRITRIVGLSGLGLGVGLALPACNPSTASAATTASGTPVSSAAPSRASGKPALFDCEGNPRVKPTKYELDCFDAINDLENLHWTAWGRTAAATGTEELNYCVPSCTTRKSSYYPVSIRAFGNRNAPGEPPAYTEMTISYAGPMPAVSSAETGGVITQRTSHSWTEKLPLSSGE